MTEDTKGYNLVDVLISNELTGIKPVEKRPMDTSFSSQLTHDSYKADTEEYARGLCVAGDKKKLH